MDAEAERKIVEHYPLARKQVAHFVHHGKFHHLADELESAAMHGLMRATHYHKPELGAKFSTFANLCIRTEMLQVLRKEKQREKLRSRLPKYLESQGIEVHYRSDADGPYCDLSHKDDLLPEDRLMAAHVRQLVDELPESERRLVRQIYFESGNPTKASHELGLHKTTGRRENIRILAKLRRQLDQKRVRPRPPEHPRITSTTGEARMDLSINRDTLTQLRNKLQTRMREIDCALTLCDSGFFDWLATEVSGNAPATPAAPAPQRRPRQLSEDIAAKLEIVLERIDGEFTRKDFSAVLSEVTGEPVADHHAYGHLARLEKAGKIEVAKMGTRGVGNSTVYRKAGEEE